MPAHQHRGPLMRLPPSTRPFVALVLLCASAITVLLHGRAAAFQNPAQAFKLPAGQQFTNTGRQLLSISPDGAQMVYVANTQLYLNRIGQSQSTAIPGTLTTQGITNPVFPPMGDRSFTGPAQIRHSNGSLLKV